MDRNLILNDGFNALVFEKRNKKYGAYQIRKRYNRNVLIAAFFAITFFSLAMGSYFINLPSANAFIPPKDSGLKIIEITNPPDHPKKEERIIKPAIQNPPPKGPDVPQNRTPEVVNKPVDAPPLNDSAGTSSKGKIGGTGVNPDPNPPCTDCDTSHGGTPPPPEPKKWVSDPPKFDVEGFFKRNCKYPQIPKEENIEGVVYLQWTVQTDGTITDIHMTKGRNKWLDAEALRVARLMPKWDPAHDNGIVVSYIFNMPVRFQLK